MYTSDERKVFQFCRVLFAIFKIQKKFEVKCARIPNILLQELFKTNLAEIEK